MNIALLFTAIIGQVAYSLTVIFLYKSSGGTIVSELSLVSLSWDSMLGIFCVGCVTYLIGTLNYSFKHRVLVAFATGIMIGVSRLLMTHMLTSSTPLRSLVGDTLQLPIRIVVGCIAVIVIARRHSREARLET